MSSLIKNIIQQKLKSLTLEELLSYSEMYEFSITKDEGKEILNYINEQPIDPFSEKGREKIFQDLREITNQQTASKARRLFDEIIQTYDLGHLFDS